MSDTPKVVPPRNNLKKQPVFVKATIADIENKDPGYHYQWVEGTDPMHPNYWGKYQGKQRIGSPEVGYCEVDGWQTVTTKDHPTNGRVRDDQGKFVDTVIRHGSMVLVRTPIENFAAYQELDRLKDEARETRIRGGESESLPGSNGGRATYKARVADNFAGNHRELLNMPQGS